jgi:hypothetical protein
MADRLLLVGWDAADWKILHPLIDAGEMPALRRLVEAGASGALLCTQPPLPVAQWTSIVTGKRPWQHRVCHPLERINGANQAVPVTAAQWRSPALWEMLARAGKRSLIVGWPATHGGRSENAVLVSDRYALPTAGPGVKPWPRPRPGTYWPEEINVRLDGLRMSPEDVQADVVSRCVPAWKKINQKQDRRLGQLRLFLATDFSHQAAMMKLLSDARWDFAAVHFPALGAISQIFLPYLPPRPDWVAEVEFGLYQNVIRSACRMLDQRLHELIQAAGTATSFLVVSAHGVNTRALPPASTRGKDPEAWKSPHGIFVACGPAFARDALVFGATVLDVAPTILTYFGLPIGDDMEGRVLIEGFVKPPEVRRVASWESARTETAPPAAEDAGSPIESKAGATLLRESDWNLARSYLDATRYEEALPILERLFRAFPELVQLGHSLFHCQLTLQRHSEAEETLEVLLDALPAGIWPYMLRAELCIARKRMKEARSLVNQAWNLHPTHPEALRRLGTLLLRVREWNALGELARQALKLDENEPLAWLGLAEAQLRQRLPAKAEEAALRAIGLNYYTPQAHFVLARAFIAQGKWQQARESMQVLLQLQPANRVAASYAKRIPFHPD